MMCDFCLYSVELLKKRASLLGALCIYATKKVSAVNRCYWNQSLQKATLGVKEEELKPLCAELF